MNIRFSLSEVDAYALNEVRFHEFYNLARSYNGKGVGEFYSSYEAMDFLNSSGLVKHDKLVGDTSVLDDEGNPVPFTEMFFTLRGQEFQYSLVAHAFFSHHSMINLKYALAALHKDGGAERIKSVKLKAKHLRDVLSNTEW